MPGALFDFLPYTNHLYIHLTEVKQMTDAKLNC